MDVKINKDWFEALSSSAPVPGGGGASALAGAGGAALCMMVANLTVGKKKYAEHEKLMQMAGQSPKHTRKRIIKRGKLFVEFQNSFQNSQNKPSRRFFSVKSFGI